MSYICYDCFITPVSDRAQTLPAGSRLTLCPRDPRYRAVAETRLRCLRCGAGVVVDLHVRRWYAAAEPGAAEAQHPLAA